MDSKKNAFWKVTLLLLPGFYSNAAPVEQQWPQQVVLEEQKIILYEPHAEKLNGDRLNARAAFAYYRTKKDEPDFGVCWIEGRIVTDRDRREAELVDIRLLDVRFPEGTDSAKARTLNTSVRTMLDHRTINVSIDELLSSLETEYVSDKDIRNNPPEIIYRSQPTVLVVLDGEPKTVSVGSYGCLRVVNTPNLVLIYPEQQEFFLFGNGQWYETNDLAGEWKTCRHLPNNIRRTAKELDPESGKMLSPAEEDLSGENKAAETAVIVRTTPAELVMTKGIPDWRSIPDTRLVFAKNTEEHLFQNIPEQRYYLLLSGRWFTSTSLERGWEYRPADQLPDDFKKIPETHPKSVVLTHVAGTTASQEAVTDARIPQTAVIERKSATCTVRYDGSPLFHPIEGTRMQYALNSTAPVLRIDSNYYVCENGVWFWGPAPEGPWQVATAVPTEIKEIPPSCPVYPVRYVYVYGFTDDYVFTGYTPGYLGCYIVGPTVVYGTGWIYPGWRGQAYYPYPATYGFNMQYDPWWGWTCGYSWMLGGSDAWLFWYWTPYPTVGWYPGWWGPYYRPPIYHYPPRDINYGPRSRSLQDVSPRSSYNLYRQRTSGVHRTSGTMREPARTQPVRNLPNNVFADPAGRVLRKTDSEWEKNNGRTWEKIKNEPRDPTSRPSAPATMPERLELQRSRGNARKQLFDNARPLSIPVPRGGYSIPSKGTIYLPRK